MLKIVIPGVEGWNDKTQEFTVTKDTEITLEHSLVSISKWESKHHKPFMGDGQKTKEEIIDYVKCMCITQNVPDESFACLTRENMNEIEAYIADSHTATTIPKTYMNGPPSHEIVTSELIYYWMITSNIPMECQKWHLNRLLMLIKVCDVKSQKPKKQSRKQTASSYAAQNAARKAKLGTTG